MTCTLHIDMLHVLDLLATELLKKTAGRYADLLVWYSRFFFLLPVGTDRAYLRSTCLAALVISLLSRDHVLLVNEVSR